MGNAIESVGQITPEWLTAVLREHGTLARGRVESVRPGTFMMATEWEPETRRRLEQGLLRRTYGRLLAHGVRDYQWDDCWNDYRLSVILVSIFIPVWRWAVFKWAPELSTLDRSMTAFKDLECADLLGTA